MEKKLSTFVKKWRTKLGIDPRWTIHVEVVPVLRSEATTEIHSDRWEAWMEFGDRLEDPETVVIHEVLELALYEIAELWWNVIDETVEDSSARVALDKSMAAARNRLIEKLVPLLRDQP